MVYFGITKMQKTTIKLDKKTKKRLDRLKSYRRESYDDVLQKVLGILNICRINPEKARMRLIQ
ncbi:MAG: hypothetical protein UY10_C0018G0012, partial [Microgenomates group bacterium GW2011_GWA2_47_8]